MLGLLIVRLQGSATSVVRSRLVGTEKFSVFVLQMVFLDDSGGNKTLRKWEHWLGGTKSGSSQIISLQTGFHGKQSIEGNERNAFIEMTSQRAAEHVCWEINK